MNKSTRSLVVVAVLAVIVATVAIGVSATPGSDLVVTDADTGEKLLEVPVEDGEEVTLSYTHSVEKTPVKDVYVVDGAELRTDRMVFHSHGAGLPSGSEVERTDEGFVVRPDESYDVLPVVPGSIAEHELVVGDERYDLVERSDGPVRITVSDRSLSDRTIGTVLSSVDGLQEPHWISTIESQDSDGASVADPYDRR